MPGPQNDGIFEKKKDIIIVGLLSFAFPSSVCVTGVVLPTPPDSYRKVILALLQELSGCLMVQSFQLPKKANILIN